MKKLFLIILIITFFKLCIAQKVLIVNDNASNDCIEYYTQELNNMGITYEILDTKNNPNLSEILNNNIILWICGDSFYALNQEEKDILDKFLQKNDKIALYLEGDNLLYDSAFIDSGFFFYRNFGIEFLKRTQLSQYEISTDWNNPLTWGMPEKFILYDIQAYDIMKCNNNFENNIIFKVTNNNNPNKWQDSSECIGIIREFYNKKIVLLSFSPATRNIWELETSQFKTNLLEWLTDDYKSIAKRLISQNTKKRTKGYSTNIESDIKSLIRLIKLGIENNSLSELDYIIKMKKSFPPAIWLEIKNSIKGIYKTNPEFQKNIAIKTRITLLDVN